MACQGLESPCSKDEEIEAKRSHDTCLRSHSPNEKTRKSSEPSFAQSQKLSSFFDIPVPQFPCLKTEGSELLQAALTLRKSIPRSELRQ